MKKTIFTLALLLVASITQTMSANRVFETRGDTVIIARDGDTVRFSGKQTIKELAGILDDTIINLNEEDAQMMEGESSDGLNERVAQWEDTAVESQRIWASTAESIGIAFIWGTVALIFLILLISYLKRRRKYKMVEKAIENNYPLPPYIFDGQYVPQQNYTYTPTAPTPGTPITEGIPTENSEPSVDENGNPTPPPFNPQGDPWTSHVAEAPVTGTPRMNWRAFQTSFVLIAIGLGLMIMFHESALVGIFSILVLIGLGKGFIEYQDQRDAINAWRNRK